jgi:molybdopterin molybdotransferase
VAFDDLSGPAPRRLPVRGESRAGRAPPPLVPGTACRIFTGAPLPPGSDTVVMQEEVDVQGGMAVFRTSPRRGTWIRRAGEDVPSGAVAMHRGTRLGAAHLALASMLGQSRLTVARRPQVSIACVGDELREPGDGGGEACLFESNGPALRALARQAGAQVRLTPIVRDDLAEATGLFDAEAGRCDLLVTVGGASVGDYDLVRPALEASGVSLDFWKVAIKPGKPLAVGRRGDTLVLVLPGNPASAFVTFLLFGMPVLRSMQGDVRPLPAALRAPLATEVVRTSRRAEFLRARLEMGGEGARVVLHPNQASGALSSLAWCDALARIPEGVERLDAGSLVEVLRIADA